MSRAARDLCKDLWSNFFFLIDLFCSNRDFLWIYVTDVAVYDLLVGREILILVFTSNMMQIHIILVSNKEVIDTVDESG